MTAASVTALEFAQRCMGWEGATDGGAMIFLPNETHPWFSFTDLNAVIDQVVEFTNRHRLAWFRLDYSMPDRMFYAKVRGGITRDFECEAISGNPCTALMAACIRAAKKLEAV